MKMTAKQRAYFVREMEETFGRSEAESNQMVEQLQRVLSGQDQEIVYALQYSLFRNEDHPEYVRKLIHFLFHGFSYLYRSAETEEEREQLHVGNEMLFNYLFVDRYLYATTMERRSNAAQHILKNVSDQLNDLLTTQERMLANLSHEMRTSLNAITGYLALIEENHVLRGEEAQYLEKAQSGAQSLQSLVKDLLDITKLNSNQLEIHAEYFSPHAMLLDAINHVPIMDNPHVVFGFVPAFFPYRVRGDKMHTMEVVINFLSNAFKYTEAGNVKLEMHVETLPRGAQIGFRVTDTGVGMTPEQVENIFTPYSRYQMTKQGLGLGMYIAKQLTERLGGTLHVSSTPGAGSAFEVRFIFDDIQPVECPHRGKKIFVFLESEEARFAEDEKADFFRASGVDVQVYHDEAMVIGYLLDPQSETPDILVIHGTPSTYTKFDPLIYYLRSQRRFDRTLFLAEETGIPLPLKYFDEVCQYSFDVSRYCKIFTERSEKKREAVVESDTTLRILVVDDITTNRDIFKLFVQKRYPHAEIDTAGGGHEALAMCRLVSYDVMFLDLKMPGLDGYQLLQRLQTDHPALPPVYAFSADVYKETYRRVKESGFTGLLEKPLQPEKLFALIEELST